jgi:hypothetical protein
MMVPEGLRICGTPFRKIGPWARRARARAQQPKIARETPGKSWLLLTAFSAVDTETDRGTIGRYLVIAQELGLPRERDLSEDEFHEVGQRVQAAPVARPSASAGWVDIAAHNNASPLCHSGAWLGREQRDDSAG